ncbi:GNAT family N-acetyltransferase [Streptomyces sp. TRM66268-LWL]|uniref:GNAT family N-acetyltransferase n=1 Tax=Streptomyces polyasparticus TaxID=2767826 RepID=A0ABR7SUW5_9ACTN|nr:GNAT family N-acyltransferase [Streptomyces polyasparticus]MBC9718727.1 GNAT family N-acetyltransferase [Streptomyces polyasparticus]
MPSPALSTVTVDSAAYTVTIADTPEQVRAAQRLRHDVFGSELGARLHSPEPGLDIDEFDAVADHLIVTETGSGEVVGTYRLIPPGRGARLYSESEFDLAALAPIRPHLVEAGRSCVHPDHRTGAVINLLWSALARYVLLSGHEYLAGCASVPLDDGGRAATSAWLLGTAKHAAPADLRVHPHRPWQPAGPLGGTPSYADLPPLLRGYLRLGAWMCGAPAHDPEFGVADFYVLLPMVNVSDRYRRYFLGEGR